MSSDEAAKVTNADARTTAEAACNRLSTGRAEHADHDHRRRRRAVQQCLDFVK